MLLDLNHQSGLIYGIAADGRADTTARVNAHIDAAITARNQRQAPRDYLGGSRIGEECARKLVYEVTHTPKDTGRDFPAGILRIFDAGHQIEALAIRWLRQAGFDLRDRNAEGTQFGFTAAGGKLRGHADGVIVAGPDIGIRWPALWESKALGQKSWTHLVKHGLRQSKPIYFAQVQLYMAYFELEVALLTAVNRDSLDRIDPEGDYTPGNCRWALPEVQARNKRITRWYLFQGEPMVLAQVAAHLGVPRHRARTLERKGQLPAWPIPGIGANRIDANCNSFINLNDALTVWEDASL
jgi:hypothetical protein